MKNFVRDSLTNGIFGDRVMMWFLYEKWRDVMVFHWAGEDYLLQGTKNKITRATKFRIGNPTRFRNIELKGLCKDKLMAANLWENGDQLLSEKVGVEL